MLSLRGEVAAQGEEESREQRGEARLAEGAAGEELRAACGDDKVQEDGNFNGDRCGKENERPVERVEHPGLWISQEGRAHEEVRIPQGQMAGEQNAGAVIPVRVKVEEGVAASEDEVSKGEFPEEEEDEANPKAQEPDPNGSRRRNEGGKAAHGAR